MAILTHIPWAHGMARRLPVLSSSLQRLRKFAFNAAMGRVNAGAVKKDLWYHLVSSTSYRCVRPVLNVKLRQMRPDLRRPSRRCPMSPLTPYWPSLQGLIRRLQHFLRSSTSSSVTTKATHGCRRRSILCTPPEPTRQTQACTTS